MYDFKRALGARYVPPGLTKERERNAERERPRVQDGDDDDDDSLGPAVVVWAARPLRNKLVYTAAQWPVCCYTYFHLLTRG